MDMKLNLSKQLNLHQPCNDVQHQETKFDRAKRIARRCILYFVDWVIEWAHLYMSSYLPDSYLTIFIEAITCLSHSVSHYYSLMRNPLIAFISDPSVPCVPVVQSSPTLVLFEGSMVNTYL